MSRVAVCINSQLTAMIQNHVREVVPKQQKVVPQLFQLENAYINKNSNLPSYLYIWNNWNKWNNYSSSHMKKTG
jgi:hypothetical protein